MPAKLDVALGAVDVDGSLRARNRAERIWTQSSFVAENVSLEARMIRPVVVIGAVVVFGRSYAAARRLPKTASC